MAYLCHHYSKLLLFPSIIRRKYSLISVSQKVFIKPFKSVPLPSRSIWCSSKPFLGFCTGTISQCSVSEEILFFRESRNGFQEVCFSDPKEPYGPPLAILLPTPYVHEALVKELVEFYGEKGFDVVTVCLRYDQLLFPCRAGGAMNVVTDLLEYLNEAHKHRPYIFHGFSVGIYMFGEILAQFSDHYETYRAVSDNVKGCLWDSPVDVFAVKSLVGKHFYPKNWFRRWKINQTVKKHFKEHPHDSVDYWYRSWTNFCNPLIRVPHVFFVSYSDVLSNPCSLQCIQNKLECNGIPIFEKIWWDSVHAHHLADYWYEYLYGMLLFFDLSNLKQDECGKYRGSYSTASFTYLKPNEEAINNYCLQCYK